MRNTIRIYLACRIALLHWRAAQSSDCDAPRSVCLHDGTPFPQKSLLPSFRMYFPVFLAAEPTCNRYPANESRPRPPLPGATSFGSTVNAWASVVGSVMPKYTFESQDRKSTRLNSSHVEISYAVFCLKKKKHNISTSDSASFSG